MSAVLYIATIKSEEATRRLRKLEHIRRLVRPIIEKATPLQKKALVNKERWRLYRGPYASGKTTYLLLDYFKHMFEAGERYNGVLIVSIRSRYGIRDLMRCVVDHYPYKLGLDIRANRSIIIFKCGGHGSQLRFMTPADFFYKSQGLDLSWFGMDPDGTDKYDFNNPDQTWFKTWLRIKEEVNLYSRMSYHRHGKKNPHGRVRIAKLEQFRHLVDQRELYQEYVGRFVDRKLNNA